MDELFGDIGPEIIGRKSIVQPEKKSGSFDDPPVPRAAGVIAGCVIATIIALMAVSYILMLVAKPSTRPAIFVQTPK